MKILYIDPWCVNGSSLYSYTTGMLHEISKREDITLVAPYGILLPEKDRYRALGFFFRHSANMRRGFYRTIIRGLEYIKAYRRILSLCRKEHYDIVEVEWPLLYKVDAYFFKKIKKHCKKFVLKAHNVLPHSTGNKYKEDMRVIYSIADIVLVHGEGIKREFAQLFPEYESKVRIQRHGMFENYNVSYDSCCIPKEIKSKIESSDRVYLCYGTLHEDKGIDRLAEIWLNDFKNSRAVLVIAGQVPSSYTKLLLLEDRMKQQENMCYLKGYIDDNLLNYLLSKSKVVILPYVVGSMSGVAFSCAAFKKTILATKFGSIDEYIIPNTTGFIVDNSNEGLKKGIKRIEESIDNDTLEKMGFRLGEYFKNNYSWERIANRLIDEVYCENIGD